LKRMPKLLVLGAAVAALAAAGCGGGGGSNTSTASSAPAAASTTPAPASGGSSSGGTQLSLAADPSGSLKFDKSSLSAKAGKVTITMDNPSAIAHGVAIKGNGVNSTGSIVNKGGKSVVTANLKPGTYTFYCPVPGHEQAGMKGTLTVK
jgi:plastocyanin